jgi:hypothetical protein
MNYLINRIREMIKAYQANYAYSYALDNNKTVNDYMGAL